MVGLEEEEGLWWFIGWGTPLSGSYISHLSTFIRPYLKKKEEQSILISPNLQFALVFSWGYAYLYFFST